MRAVLDAMEFKRLVDNTKSFTAATTGAAHHLMKYIYIQVDKETGEVRATALDGHRASIEYGEAMEVDESFSCFIKPVIPKITKGDREAVIEVIDKKAYVTVSDNITGYVQPEGTYYDIDKIIDGVLSKEPESTVMVNPDYLKAAASQSISSYQKNIVLEVRGKKEGLIIKTPRGKGKKENIKFILPRRWTEEVE